MRYHNITHCDMVNGDGLRTVLWLAGCSHQCHGCQNPITWDTAGGLPFDEDAEAELFGKLSFDWVSGLTLSGGDPLNPANVDRVTGLCQQVKDRFPDKTIWVYTGYTWEQVKYLIPLWRNVDVLVDGKFIKELASVNYPWAGSTNQRVIDVQQTLKEGKVILWES